MRLLVDEKYLIDDLKPHALKADSRTITLQAGKLTSILLRTTQPGRRRVAQTGVEQPEPCAEVIPATRLYPPLFSPAMLVYAENAKPHASVLYTTTFDGPAKKLTVAGCSQPVFTPDGKQILYRTMTNAAFASSSIMHITADGTKQNQLTRPGGERCDPCISGDGQTIAYVEKTEDRLGGVDDARRRHQTQMRGAGMNLRTAIPRSRRMAAFSFTSRGARASGTSLSRASRRQRGKAAHHDGRQRAGHQSPGRPGGFHLGAQRTARCTW